MEKEFFDKVNESKQNSCPEFTHPTKQVGAAFPFLPSNELQEKHFISVSSKEPGNLYCKVCNVTFEFTSEEKIKQHIGGKVHKKNVKSKGIQVKMKSIPNPTPYQVKAFESMLQFVVKKYALNPLVDLSVRTQISQELVAFIQSKIPGSELGIFGSSLTCFGFKSSDVNIDLILPSDKISIPEALISVKELLMENDEVTNVKDEFDLNTPHVFFIHKKTGLSCRLCCGSGLARKTSILLKHYAGISPMVHPLVVGFRYWARCCSVDIKDGGLAPYCLALMVIQFLQNTTPPSLPILDTEKLQDEKLSRFQSKNTSTLGLLWFNLFRYYCLDFELDQSVISVRMKQPYSREERRWGHRRFAIEDPYITNHNVSSVGSDRVFEYIINCLKTSFIYYGSVPKTTKKGDSTDGIDSQPSGSGKSASNKHNEEEIFQMDDVDGDVLSNKMQYLCVASKEVSIEYQFKPEILTGGSKPEVQCQCCKKDGHATAKCPDLRKPVLKPLPQLHLSYLDMISRICAQTRGEIAFPPKEVEFRETVLCNLEDYIQELFPDARLHLFGSSMNGFGFKDSDLDICMTIDGKNKEDIDCISIIKDLSKKLKQHRDCSSVVAITTAKVPIVKFYLRSVKKEADISLYNVLALENTKMLAMYAKMDDRVSILGYTLKLFAKICDIGDASKGSLSSYAYILMLLHYLQKNHVIPVLQELYEGDKKPTKVIDSWNCWFYDDLSNLSNVWTASNSECVGSLWIGFLLYYTETFDWEHDVVCCRRTKKLTKFEKMWTRHNFAIEDPFNLDHNLGAGISRKMGNFIKTALIRGRQRFGIPPRMPLGRPFLHYFFDVDFLVDGLEAPSDRTCRVCGHIGHIARECPRLKKNRKEEKLDNGERSKLSNRPFASPNFTPRKRASTAPVATRDRPTTSVVMQHKVLTTQDSQANAPLSSNPTNAQVTQPRPSRPGFSPLVAQNQLVGNPVPIPSAHPGPNAVWPPSPPTQPPFARQRSVSESKDHSPAIIIPLGSPSNVYRRDVPLYLHAGSPNRTSSLHHVGSPLSPHHRTHHTSFQSSPHQQLPQSISALHTELTYTPSSPQAGQHVVGSPQSMSSPPMYASSLPSNLNVQHLKQNSPQQTITKLEGRMTADEFFKLFRDVERQGNDLQKAPEQTTCKISSEDTLSHAVVKPIPISPRTEEEQKLLCNLDKVRSLWSGDGKPGDQKLTTTHSNITVDKKQGLLGDRPDKSDKCVTQQDTPEPGELFDLKLYQKAFPFENERGHLQQEITQDDSKNTEGRSLKQQDIEASSKPVKERSTKVSVDNPAKKQKSIRESPGQDDQSVNESSEKSEAAKKIDRKTRQRQRSAKRRSEKKKTTEMDDQSQELRAESTDGEVTTLPTAERNKCKEERLSDDAFASNSNKLNEITQFKKSTENERSSTESTPKLNSKTDRKNAKGQKHRTGQDPGPTSKNSSGTNEKKSKATEQAVVSVESKSKSPKTMDKNNSKIEEQDLGDEQGARGPTPKSPNKKDIKTSKMKQQSEKDVKESKHGSKKRQRRHPRGGSGRAKTDGMHRH